MPPTKAEKPAVTTYADYEMIMPPNKLRKAVTMVDPSAPADDPVARAEEALAKLSSEFSGWMNIECERLDAARNQVKAKGFTRQTCEELFHAAHDIKGEAATFGFPAVASAADSLCRLIEHTPDPTKIPLSLIDKHVDAVRAIVREYARSDAEAVAASLTTRLREVTNEFLAQENRHRPDYLDGILAPPLAPGDAY
jgi:HPt (histidine-containing phosphotransfer) domain-containing protein